MVLICDLLAYGAAWILGMGVASLFGLVGGVRSGQRRRLVLVFLPGLVSN